MFRRTDKSAETVDSEPSQDKPGGKGRPTPTRKEAEAARRERARAGLDKKAGRKAQRQQRAENSRRMREGMKAGDERYLPARDQGPVRGFVRDWVDSRLAVSELLLPILLLIMVLTYSGTNTLVLVGNYLWTATILLLVVDVFWTRFRLRRLLKERFPDESQRGVTFYAMLRMVQLRFMRVPKPRVKVGGAPR